MAIQNRQLEPGTVVEVTQQTPLPTGALVATVRGTVVEAEQRKTGSWYAHARHHKLWLDRLVLRKDDGEIVVLHLDPYSRVKIIQRPPAQAEE